MGYTTDFAGKFNLNKPLDSELLAYLLKFNETRRMKRDLSHFVSKHTGQPIYGIDGEFFVGGEGFAGQERDGSVLDYNRPPSTQPTLWCGWKPNDNGTAIEWDGVEKFHGYTMWIVYIIQNFLAPNGYILNGIVSWQGEHKEDFGDLIVEDNVLKIKDHKNKDPYIFKSDLCKDQVASLLTCAIEQEVLQIEEKKYFRLD